MIDHLLQWLNTSFSDWTLPFVIEHFLWPLLFVMVFVFVSFYLKFLSAIFPASCDDFSWITRYAWRLRLYRVIRWLLVRITLYFLPPLALKKGCKKDRLSFGLLICLLLICLLSCLLLFLLYLIGPFDAAYNSIPINEKSKYVIGTGNEIHYKND